MLLDLVRLASDHLDKGRLLGSHRQEHRQLHLQQPSWMPTIKNILMLVCGLFASKQDIFGLLDHSGVWRGRKASTYTHDSICQA